jgi:hypothetical protein
VGVKSRYWTPGRGRAVQILDSVAVQSSFWTSTNSDYPAAESAREGQLSRSIPDRSF